MNSGYNRFIASESRNVAMPKGEKVPFWDVNSVA
jgi:hypothetical protein